MMNHVIWKQVRWNACYAAGGVLRPSILFEDKDLSAKRGLLIDTILPIVENFPNFKVRKQPMALFWEKVQVLLLKINVQCKLKLYLL